MPNDRSKPETESAVRALSLREINWQHCHRLKLCMFSPDEEDRRWAVQGLSMLRDAPIRGLDCWPEKKCTDLEFAAAEAILREWFEYALRYPGASEYEVIRALFPRDDEQPFSDTKARPSAAANPSRLQPLAKKLDELSDKVKEKLLDWDVCPESNELEGSEGQDCPLAPLDKERFHEYTYAKLAEAWTILTEKLAAARTDHELVAAEQAIQAILSTLKWEAIAAALELRDPYAEPLTGEQVQELAGSLTPPASPKNTEPTPTRDWADKYRRMRAAGF